MPALNDLLIANPSPGAVSRFRLGWLSKLDDESQTLPKDAKTRFAGISYDVKHSLNVWSSGMWVSTRYVMRSWLHRQIFCSEMLQDHVAIFILSPFCSNLSFRCMIGS